MTHSTDMSIAVDFRDRVEEIAYSLSCCSSGCDGWVHQEDRAKATQDVLKLLQEADNSARIDENRIFIAEISSENSTYSKHIMIDICKERIEALKRKDKER